jgi:hypothetical protein
MLRGGFDMAVQYVVAKRLLPDQAQRVESDQVDRATAVAAAAFAAASFAAAAFVPTLAARLLLVIASLAGFAVLAWTRLLDSDERLYVRGWADRATARFRVA